MNFEWAAVPLPTQSFDKVYLQEIYLLFVNFIVRDHIATEQENLGFKRHMKEIKGHFLVLKVALFKKFSMGRLKNLKGFFLA